MRHLRIFFLHLQYVFYQRAKSFVWFVIAAINPLLNLAFVVAAIKSGNEIGIGLRSATTYYFLLLTLSSLIIPHIEEKISEQDIQLGKMSSYLLKPYSYFWTCFFQEIPYRILQGSYGILIMLVFAFLLKDIFIFASDPLIISLAIVIFLLAAVIFFIFKVIIGLLAIWLVDIHYLNEFVSVTYLIFGGLILPIDLFPRYFQNITNLLPFPYLLYYPVIAFQGRLDFFDSTRIIFIQLFWLMISILFYNLVWNKGLKKFTAVGN